MSSVRKEASDEEEDDEGYHDRKIEEEEVDDKIENDMLKPIEDEDHEAMLERRRIVQVSYYILCR